MTDLDMTLKVIQDYEGRKSAMVVVPVRDVPFYHSYDPEEQEYSDGSR